MIKICTTEDVPKSKIICVRENSSKTDQEAIIINHGGDYYCWLNYCQHITTVHLDKGPGITDRNGEIICTNHGAMFDKETGHCTFGPCKGAYLSAIEIEIIDDEIYLTDDAYTLIDSNPDIERTPDSSTGESDF